MTHVDAPMVCPQCGNGTTAPLVNGNRYCPSCQLDWDPADPPTFDVPHVPEIVDLDPDGPPLLRAVDTVVAADADPETVLADLVGNRVVLVDGRTATIVGFPDEDSMTVELTDGDVVDVDYNDVRGSAEPLPVPEVPDDDTQVAIGRAALSVAGMVLEAAAASLAIEETGWVLLIPPTGWTPPEADVIPVLEQGAAYAVMTLMAAYELDPDVIREFSQRLLRDAQTQPETVEETDDDQ